MTTWTITHRRAASTRAPFAMMLCLFALALFCSGCCGSCCRAMLGDPGSSSPGSNNGTGLSNTPDNGSVASLVQQQVGAFSLVGTAPVTRLGYALKPGVVDSIGAVYNGPGGQLNQIILAYSTAAEASMRMDAVFQTIARECPGKRLMRGDIRNSSNIVIGKQVVCDQNPQHVYWSNGRVLTFVTASHPSALQFYNSSRY